MGIMDKLKGRKSPQTSQTAPSLGDDLIVSPQKVLCLKNESDAFEVEYELLEFQFPESSKYAAQRREINAALNDLDARITASQQKIDDLNEEISRLTNNADVLDYLVSVASGLLAGLIDVYFVGETNLQESHSWGNDKLEAFVKKVGGSNNLETAISNLEKKTKPFFPSDPNLNDFGGGLQHHLRDFAHHPSLAGLAFSLLTQFTGNCYGTNTAGTFIIVPVKDVSRIGNTVPEKILYGTVYWFLHLVSDMVGTSGTAGGGTGLPGPIVSLAKELSVLPAFRSMKVSDMDISVFISKAFNGTLFAEHDENGKIIKESVVSLDLRTELGMLRKQSLPVIVNELFVRTFYAARRFGMELKEKQIASLDDVGKVNWSRVVPAKNRTIARMLTIASGTFVAVDMADAAIRAAAESGGMSPAFLAKFALRVNFVGVGRFVIAIGTDVGMGIKKQRLENEQMQLYVEQIHLCNAKVFYKQADMWISAAEAGQALLDAYQATSNVVQLYYISLLEMQDTLSSIDVKAIRKHNRGLVEDILEELE